MLIFPFTSFFYFAFRYNIGRITAIHLSSFHKQIFQFFPGWRLFSCLKIVYFCKHYFSFLGTAEERDGESGHKLQSTASHANAPPFHYNAKYPVQFPAIHGHFSYFADFLRHPPDFAARALHAIVHPLVHQHRSTDGKLLRLHKND